MDEIDLPVLSEAEDAALAVGGLDRVLAVDGERVHVVNIIPRGVLRHDLVTGALVAFRCARQSVHLFLRLVVHITRRGDRVHRA